MPVVNGRSVPNEDTICECGHWYDEHDLANGKPYCEGCYQAIKPQGTFGTDADLEARFGFTHEHTFRFSEKNSTPEAIADRGGATDAWPQHVKDYFAREET